jgi:hypothetical protein
MYAARLIIYYTAGNCVANAERAQTQGKIERWHQTLKNRVLLENYFLPGDLERQIENFVEHYNHERYHESLKNVTPADVYFGRAQSILNRRERIKEKTIEYRRLLLPQSCLLLISTKEVSKVSLSLGRNPCHFI